MAAEPSPPPGPPVGAFLLLALAALLYALLLSAVADVGSTDAAGRGIELAFAMLFGVALWLVLAALLLIGALNGEMPVWGRVAAAVLLPAGGVAAIAAIDTSGQGGLRIVVPALLPPLYACYAMWARLPRSHRVLPPVPTGAVIWGAVLLLTLAPVPSWIAGTVATARREAEAQRQAEARAAAERQKRQAELDRFNKLTPASPLWDWADFIGEGKELDAQAVAGARRLAHRQADAETALQRGMGFPLIEIWRLELAATPGFCAAAAGFLRADAAAHPAPAGMDGNAAYAVIQQNFSPYLDAVEWLTHQGCDIDAAAAQVAQTVAAYPQSSSRDGFLAVLAWRRGNGFYKRQAWERAVAAYGEAVRLDPQNAQFFKNRGDAAYAKGDYDRAIADYGEAVRLNKFYAAAVDSRGNAYHAKGEDDRALADYDEAIRLNPHSAPAFNNRGNLLNERGEHRKAIADFNEALKLDPQSRIMLNNRARAHFFAAEYRPAAVDFAASLQRQPDDAYAALWLYLARARAGDDARDLLRADAGRLERSGWPWPLVAAFLGDGTAADAVEKAQQDQKCEADFYLGAKAATEGDTARAHALLRQAQAICPAGWLEAPAARFELARLAQ